MMQKPLQAMPLGQAFLCSLASRRPIPMVVDKSVSLFGHSDNLTVSSQLPKPPNDRGVRLYRKGNLPAGSLGFALEAL